MNQIGCWIIRSYLNHLLIFSLKIDPNFDLGWQLNQSQQQIKIWHAGSLYPIWNVQIMFSIRFTFVSLWYRLEP